jgi:hypothetical protein
MIKLLEFAECLIAGILFLVVIAGLPGVRNESAFQLAYVVLAIDVMLLGVGLNYIFAHFEMFSRVRYFAISGGMAGASWLAFVLIASISNVTDSSHGGSIWIVVAGSIALVLVGSVLVSRRKRAL